MYLLIEKYNGQFGLLELEPGDSSTGRFSRDSSMGVMIGEQATERLLMSVIHYHAFLIIPFGYIIYMFLILPVMTLYNFSPETVFAALVFSKSLFSQLVVGQDNVP